MQSKHRPYPPSSETFSGHRPLKPAEGPHAAPVFNDAESPLGWLRTRKDKAGQPLISDAQYLAELSDGTIAARRRYIKALEAVGPELSSILTQVCCLSAGLEQAERVLNLPQRSGKAVLGLALTALARHYGLLQAPRPQSDLCHWGLPDFRPVIAHAELEDA
jgi:Domain of unknown function (DUF6456)